MSGRRGRGRVELPRVRIVGGMLELAVGSQVVRSGVRRAAERTLEPAGEMHVVVVAYVRDHFPAELATVQVQRAGHPLEREPHVPALRACNHHTPSPQSPPRMPQCQLSVGAQWTNELFSQTDLSTWMIWSIWGQRKLVYKNAIILANQHVQLYIKLYNYYFSSILFSF